MLYCFYPSKISVNQEINARPKDKEDNLEGISRLGGLFPLTPLKDNGREESWRSGQLVNIETDILAKYMESLLGEMHPGKKHDLDRNFLKNHGYA